MIALAEEGSFTRAASRVGIAQPPFSKQIRDLEREIGTGLVQRLSKGAVLTAAGAAFVARARAIEAAFGAAADEARRVGAGLEGRLRIGFTETGIFHPTLVDSFLAYRTRYAAVELVLEEQMSTTLIAMLHDASLDAAFIRPPYPHDEEWERMDVACEPMMAAVPKGHLHATKRSIRLTDLRDDTFVFYHRRLRPGLTDSVISACERAGFEPREGQIVPKITTALRLVAAGAGVAVVPESLSRVAANDVRFLRLADDAPRAEIALVWRSRHLSPTLSGFIAEVKRVAETQRVR